MIRHRDGGTRRSGAPGLPSSVPELARTLRRVRTRQGLRLEDVSARTGVSLAQLEALESGTVDRIPDQVAIVKALRTYASSLGLSGDQFALSLVEHWPSVRNVQAPVLAVNGTGVVPTVGPATAMVPSVGAGAGEWTEGPDALSSVTTGPVPAGTPWPGTAGQSSAAAVPLPAGTFQPGIADTGITPTVSGAAHRPRRPRTGAPLWLWLLVGLVGLAVLVGLAGLVVQEVEPSWLRSLGITHPTHPTHPDQATGGQTGTPGTPGGTGGSGSAGSTSTTAAGGGGRGDFHLVSTTPTTATFDVASPKTGVEVIAVGGPSWVQVSEIGQTAPLFAGILEAGQSKSFPVEHSLAVEVGSSAAHVYVSADGKNLGFYFPPAAPYTMTFQTGS
ncbi:MAG TPA: RodZ domain-containing protein [Acidimicrobiales bacterium]|nr:RodZ domain-containing protein [Acidimicrobiales bacterium]